MMEKESSSSLYIETGMIPLHWPLFLRCASSQSRNQSFFFFIFSFSLLYPIQTLFFSLFFQIQSSSSHPLHPTQSNICIISTNTSEYTHHLRYGFSRTRAPHSSHSCLEIHASTLFAIYFAYTAAPVNTECFRFGCAYPQLRPAFSQSH